MKNNTVLILIVLAIAGIGVFFMTRKANASSPSFYPVQNIQPGPSPIPLPKPAASTLDKILSTINVAGSVAIDYLGKKK